MVRAALERGLHVFCEKPLTLIPEDSDELTALAARARPRHPGRLPQPLRRGLPRGAGAARRRRDRRGHARPRRGLRAGRAEAEGRHLAQQGGRGRRLPLRLRRARDRPDQLVLRASRPGSGARCCQRSSPRRPTTRSSAPSTSTAAQTGQLSVNWSRRVLAQDDDEGQHLGHGGADLRRPAGMPGLPARHGARSPTATSRAGTSATRPS